MYINLRGNHSNLPFFFCLKISNFYLHLLICFNMASFFNWKMLHQHQINIMQKVCPESYTLLARDHRVPSNIIFFIQLSTYQTCLKQILAEFQKFALNSLSLSLSLILLCFIHSFLGSFTTKTSRHGCGGDLYLSIASSCD